VTYDERSTVDAKAAPVATMAAWLAEVSAPAHVEATSGAADAWARHLSRLLAVELRRAVVDETLTPAEAEQLLARLMLVIDQAITTTQ
jgi:hypothetical protein